MAVNGIDLAVGQTWITRTGVRIHLTHRLPGQAFCWGTQFGYRFTNVGVCSGDERGYDLMELSRSSALAAEAAQGAVPLKPLFAAVDWSEHSGREQPPATYNQSVEVELCSGARFTQDAASIDWEAMRAQDCCVKRYRIVSDAECVKGGPLDLGVQCMRAPGYEKLADVLIRAYTQAAAGKGRERHANGQPFEDQPMSRINRQLGSIDGFIYQAQKKSLEAKRLPTERAKAELLGAINYLAGAVIALDTWADPAEGAL